MPFAPGSAKPANSGRKAVVTTEDFKLLTPRELCTEMRVNPFAEMLKIAKKKKFARADHLKFNQHATLAEYLYAKEKPQVEGGQRAIFQVVLVNPGDEELMGPSAPSLPAGRTVEISIDAD